MNTSKAQQLLSKAAHLVQLTTTFQARYGRDYQVKPGSPALAWELYEAIQTEQSIIARLLEPDVIEERHYRYGKWWMWREVMDTSTARALVIEASHLIACCVHAELATEQTISYAVRASQACIAGMLHPASIQIGLDESIHLAVG